MNDKGGVIKNETLINRPGFDINETVKIGALLGRLSSGLQSDHGTLYHAVILKTQIVLRSGIETQRKIYVGLCGAKPGRKSVGWSFNHGTDHGVQAVTCQKCLKRLSNIEKRKNNDKN